MRIVYRFERRLDTTVVVREGPNTLSAKIREALSVASLVDESERRRVGTRVPDSLDDVPIEGVVSRLVVGGGERVPDGVLRVVLLQVLDGDPADTGMKPNGVGCLRCL